MPERVVSVDWSGVRNVLAVRLDAMGDVLMTGPALRALRETLAGSRMTLLTSPSGADAASLLPEVDETIVYDAPWMKATAPRESPAPDLAMIERLAGARFDAAVIFTVFSQNPLPAALLCHLAGLPLRLAHCRENPYQLLTNRVPEIEPNELIRHEVRRQLDLVAAVGCRTFDERMRVDLPAEARNRIRQRLAHHGLAANGRWVVLHTGSTAPSRRYPPESFAVVIRELSRELALRVVLTGGPSEAETIDGILDAAGVGDGVSLAGQLSLAELAALLAEAPLLVSNNTGPVHLAASVGTPVVDLYALTNPQHTPWAVPHRVLNQDVPCKYCYRSICPQGHHDCLRQVEPGRVVAAVAQLLSLGDEHLVGSSDDIVLAPVAALVRRLRS